MTSSDDRIRQLVESLSADEKMNLVAQLLDDDPVGSFTPQA